MTRSAALEAARAFQDWQARYASAARSALDLEHLASARVFQRKAAEAHQHAVWAMRDYQRKG